MPETHWPHAPHHRLCERGTYIVTAGTYQKSHVFAGAGRLAVLHRGLLAVAREFDWQLEAWAVFSNHYHFIGHTPGDPTSLSRMLSRLHERTARWTNRLDQTPGRKVWHNYWETRLTHEKSYFARLHYVHQNAVKHRLVLTANAYPWCSAGWFERSATRAQVNTIYGFPMDRLKVLDDYSPASEW
jgi:putative transposase